MDKRIKDALRKLAGEDDALFEDMVAKVDDVNRSAAGMINREQTPATANAKPKPAAKTAAPVAAATPAPVVREISDADIDAVLGSDRFAARFSEMLDAAIEARSKSDDEEGEEEPATEEEETEPTGEADESTRTILAEIQKLNARVEELSKERDAEVQEVLNDLPARIAKTNIVRPRATRMPIDVNNRQAVTNMADVAAQTAAALGWE